MKKLKVAILGSGNIGTDLLIKVMRSEYLDCGVFIGRNFSSQGIQKAQSLGVQVSAEGIEYIKKNPDCCDIVFDCTSAVSHFEHAPVLADLKKFVVDLTPAKVGVMCIPAVNLAEALKSMNVNMITCGGQASIPVAYAIGQTQTDIEYIEVVSAIASKSAGPATRINLDEYIHTTEEGIRNLNPAIPCINMQTTIMAKVKQPNIEKLKPVLDQIVQKVRTYVPGYELIVGPVVEDGRIFITLKVKGLGDYLPAYAGNLDIINCAALAMAEEYAKK
jgi:acetaldehyde dehydrogenase (acetylating)